VKLQNWVTWEVDQQESNSFSGVKSDKANTRGVGRMYTPTLEAGLDSYKFWKVKIRERIKKVVLAIPSKTYGVCEQFRQTFNHSSMGMALIDGQKNCKSNKKNFAHIISVYTEAELQQIDLERNCAIRNDLIINRLFLIEDCFHGKHKYKKFRAIGLYHKDGSCYLG